MIFNFSSTIRLRNNGKQPASWHFVTLPEDISDQIKQIDKKTMTRKGRGLVKVKARIGFLDRESSIFPDKKRNAYILPIKADIRKQLHVKAGDEVHINITLI